MSLFIFSETCGGTYHGYKGVITSPQFPNFYESRENCTWNIQVPQGMKVSFKVALFEMNIAADYNEMQCRKHTHLELDELIPLDNSSKKINYLVYLVDNKKLYLSQSG